MDDEQPPLFDMLTPIERATPASLQQMHLRYGKCADKQCGNCQHYVRYKASSRRWAKCNLTRQSASEATDWHARYEACGRFSDDRN